MFIILEILSSWPIRIQTNHRYQRQAQTAPSGLPTGTRGKRSLPLWDHLRVPGASNVCPGGISYGYQGQATSAPAGFPTGTRGKRSLPRRDFLRVPGASVVCPGGITYNQLLPAPPNAPPKNQTSPLHESNAAR